jgi:hypothetical protein
MGMVDDLVANPGSCPGIDPEGSSGSNGAARVVVSARPGGSGVTLDCGTFDPATPSLRRGHIEHTVIERP